MPKLKKMPIDVEELLSSPRFQAFKDFQKWWFVAVLFNMWNQRQPGLLEMTENFYRIVGAHSLPMWQNHGGAVMAAFERVERDGKTFLYSPKVEALWNAKQKSHQRLGNIRKAESPPNVLLEVGLSDFANEIWKVYPEERRKEKPRAIQEINKAIQRLTKATLAEFQDRFGKIRMVPITSELDASQFLHEALLEYRESPEGRRVQFVPYPERWFKREKYLEPRAGWFLEERADGNRAYEKQSQNRAAIAGAIRESIFGEPDGHDFGEVPKPDYHQGDIECVAEGLGLVIPPGRKGTV